MTFNAGSTVFDRLASESLDLLINTKRATVLSGLNP